MIKLYILLLSFFHINFTGNFQNTLTIEKNIFIENQDISTSSVEFNGVVNINTNDTMQSTFSVENTEQSTSIYFNGINLISDIFQLGLDNNNQLVAIYKKNQTLSEKKDQFDTLSTNFIVPFMPLEEKQTITINNSPQKGDTYFGKETDEGEKNIIFLTQNLFFNTNNITATKNGKLITLQSNISADTINSQTIILTNNISLTSKIKTKNLVSDALLNNQSLALFTNRLEISSINCPLTKISTIKITALPIQTNIPTGQSINGFITIDQENKLGITKELFYINSVNTLNCSNTNVDNSEINFTILNSLSNNSSKSIQTQNIALKNINVNSINLNNYIVTIPNNTIETNTDISLAINNKIQIDTMEVDFFVEVDFSWSSSQKLYLPKNIFIPNIPIVVPSNEEFLVLDINNEGIWGHVPRNSIENIENIEDFTLSKKEFLSSIKPIIAETKDKKLITTMCKNKIGNSPICSLIIDCDEQGEALYYDNEGIMAIAASQLETIEKEKLTYEEEIEKLKISFAELIFE
jgi:hypothetical protein